MKPGARPRREGEGSAHSSLVHPCGAIVRRRRRRRRFRRRHRRVVDGLGLRANGFDGGLEAGALGLVGDDGGV